MCPVCFDDFTFLHDLRQHLIHDDCQPEQDEGGGAFRCDVCTASLPDVEEFKDHRLGHMDKGLFSCSACGTKFSAQRALDKHMLVDAAILNKLRSSREAVTLPDLLCRTVVDILAETADVPGSGGGGGVVGKVQGAPATNSSDDDDDDEEEEEVEGGSEAKNKSLKGRGGIMGEEGEDLDDEDDDNDEELEVDDDDDDDDDEEDENDEAEVEDCDESNLPSEIEQDLDEAEEDSEEAGEVVSKIPRPFLSSSLTDDDPATPPLPNDRDHNDDSVASLSHHSAEDAGDKPPASAAASSSSRRKSKCPMQVQRVAPASPPPKALKMGDGAVIKVEPEDEDEVNPPSTGLWNENKEMVE